MNSNALCRPWNHKPTTNLSTSNYTQKTSTWCPPFQKRVKQEFLLRDGFWSFQETHMETDSQQYRDGKFTSLVLPPRVSASWWRRVMEKATNIWARVVGLALLQWIWNSGMKWKRRKRWRILWIDSESWRNSRLDHIYLVMAIGRFWSETGPVKSGPGCWPGLRFETGIGPWPTGLVPVPKKI